MSRGFQPSAKFAFRVIAPIHVLSSYISAGDFASCGGLATLSLLDIHFSCGFSMNMFLVADLPTLQSRDPFPTPVFVFIIIPVVLHLLNKLAVYLPMYDVLLLLMGYQQLSWCVSPHAPTHPLTYE
jgi:hypothetical protein